MKYNWLKSLNYHTSTSSTNYLKIAVGQWVVVTQLAEQLLLIPEISHQQKFIQIMFYLLTAEKAKIKQKETRNLPVKIFFVAVKSRLFCSSNIIQYLRLFNLISTQNYFLLKYKNKGNN